MTIQVSLGSISPVAFSVVREGDVVEIKIKKPSATEFRGQGIGAGVKTYLVFKGITKVGMIPVKIADSLEPGVIKKRARVKIVDGSKKVIVIEFAAPV